MNSILQRSESSRLAWLHENTLVRRMLLVGALLALVAGCGLSAYEAKMAAAQRRADEFDRKEVTLAAGITAPDSLPVDLTLRAPRGIAAKPDPTPQNGFFYRYGASGKGQIHELLLGASADGNANFARQHIQKMFPSATALPVKTVDVAEREPLSFETWTEGDATGKTYIYLHQTGGLVVVLAFRAGKADAEVEAAIDASLKTLVVKPRLN